MASWLKVCMLIDMHGLGPAGVGSAGNVSAWLPSSCCPACAPPCHPLASPPAKSHSLFCCTAWADPCLAAPLTLIPFPGPSLPPNPLVPWHPAPLQDITACESEATKKGVQAGNAQKQLDKLRKEAEKNGAEREKLTAQQQQAMQV